MRNPKMNMKQEFINKWTLTLNTCYKDSRNYMSLLEKQNAIKQTAAIAMAASKQHSTAWSHAILANDQPNNKSTCTISSIKRKLTSRSKKRVKSTKKPMKMILNKDQIKAKYVAKMMIKKQTQVLKRLVPGGDSIDECCLIDEALDYIVSLKVQVDVMKELVIAAEYMKKNP